MSFLALVDQMERDELAAADAEEERFEEWANTQDGDDLDLDQYERMRERSEWLSLVS